MTINEYKELIKQHNPPQDHSPASGYRLHKYAELLSYHGLSVKDTVTQLQADHLVGKQGFNLERPPVKEDAPWIDYLKGAASLVVGAAVLIVIASYLGWLIKLAFNAI